MSRKWGGSVPFLGRRAGFHLAQCGLYQCPPPCQMSPLSIQPFGHNRSRHVPKIGERGSAPFLGRGAGSSSNTMWPVPRPTRMPSFILIHPTVWLQYCTPTSQRGQDRQRSDSIERTGLQSVTQKRVLSLKNFECIYSSESLTATTYMRRHWLQ